MIHFEVRDAGYHFVFCRVVSLLSRSHATWISGRFEHLFIVLAELGDLHANLLILLLLFVVLHRLVVDLILKLLDHVATLTRFGSFLSSLWY